MKKIILTIICLFVTTVYAERITVIETSGLLFKDTLEVHAFDDPTIGGITCYVTTPKKSLSFADPTNVSISCRKFKNIDMSTVSSKERIYKKSKNVFVKSLYVNRIYDRTRNVLIYVAYTDKLTGSNASNSISVVVLNQGDNS